MILFQTTLAYAQLVKKDSLTALQPYRAVNKFTPFPILWGPSITFSSEYRYTHEVVTAKNQSVQFSVSYLGTNIFAKAITNSLGPSSSIAGFYLRGARFQLSTRIYAKRSIFGENLSAPEGFYLSPHFSYAQAYISSKQLQSRGIYYRAINYNFNVLFGAQRTFGTGVAFDWHIGMGIKHLDVIYHSSRYTKSIEPSEWFIFTGPFKFSLGFTIGIPIKSMR